MKRALPAKALLLSIPMLLGSLFIHAQVTTNGGSGLATTYTSLGAAITALNAATISSPVVINLAASNPQTAPTGGFEIRAEGSSVNTITINGNGNTITASAAQVAGNLYDGIVKIIGGDYITLNGFTLIENPANTNGTAATNNMTEFGVALFYSTATNGAQNNTIKNCTIDLDRTYQNTFGIYSNSGHTATNPSAIANATAVTGSNSGLTIVGNTVTDVNVGIVYVGSAIADMENDGLTIGGPTVALGNTISNFGTNSIISSYANVSTSINGILLRYIKNYNVSNNTITSSNGGLSTGIGTLNGVYVQSGTAQPSGTITNTVANNTVSLVSGVPVTQIFGIRLEALTANATTTLNITGNSFTNFNHSIAGSTGAITGIVNAGGALVQNISNNSFVNLSPITAGSFTFINNNVAVPDGGSQVIGSNSIVTGFSKTGDGGFVTLFTSSAASGSMATISHSSNNFSNINVAGATAIAGWVSGDGASATNGPVKTVSNNIFANWTVGTGNVNVLTVNGSGVNSNVFNNSISGVAGGGGIAGINIMGNDNANYYGNNINSLIGSSAVVNGIVFTGAATTNVLNLYKNKIYNLSATGTDGLVNGISVDFAVPVLPATSSFAITVYNNLIGDLKAPSASNASSDAVRGISVTTVATSNIKLYFNTISISATSSGTNFSTSGIYHVQNATPSIANLDLRNNIIINNSVANGSGIVAAFKRSATGLDNYAVASNNNIFYGGIPSAKNVIYYNGTAYQTMNDFKILVAARETASKTENVSFLSTAGANANFLHINPIVPTFCESGGVGVAGIIDDYDGNIRSLPPDIGADEFVGVVVPVSLLNFTGTKQPSGNLLNWVTANEVNNTGFELQRSADGMNYNRITFISSKAVNGNSNGSLAYSFTDKNQLGIDAYYRLKQVDKDGMFNLSTVVLIKGSKASSLEILSTYPNPAANYLNVIVASPQINTINLIVCDLSGKIVLRKQASVVEGDNTIQFNIGALAKGSYTVKALCNDGSPIGTTGKFIKQ